MAIYEYKCGKCDYVGEYIMKDSDPAPTPCPGCGYDKMARLISKSNFKLEGSGWYKDGYTSTKKTGKSIESKL